jgi:isocitrate lyase
VFAKNIPAIYVGGYQVKTSDAIAALEQKAPDSAQWWKDNVPLQAVVHLVFSKAVCEMIA